MGWAGLVLWLHVMAAMFWVGGQLFLVLVVLPVLRQEVAEAERVRIVAAAGRRFAALSGVALAVLVVTGPLNAIAHGISQSTLNNTTWGHVLAAKVVLVIVMLALTATHGVYYGRKLERLHVAAGPNVALAGQRQALQRQSARVSALNLVLNLVIVALAVWLATLP
jgi:putative copper resistance protein D